MSERPTALLGIDLGSTEIKAGLVTRDGRLLAISRHRYATTVDAGRGTAEQDPDAWWVGLVTVVRDLTGRIDADVAGIAVDGHGPSLTAVDRLGRPTRSSITWLDRRAGQEERELAAATGLQGWALGVLPAALWLERHEPEVAGRTAWYLNSWEALALRMTGMARVSLVLGQLRPAPDALTDLGIPAGRMAEAIGAGEHIGGLERDAATALGLPAGTPVVAGVVDAFASFHGAGMLQPGDAIDPGGAAGGFGAYWDRDVRADGSFTTPAPLPGQFVIGGAMAATGRAVEWLRDDVLGGGRSTEALIEEAATIEPGAGGVVFLPYLVGERSPIWDPDARGAFVGLSLNHGRAHLARAVLEAAALAIRHVAEPILGAGVRVEAMRVCGGPARSGAWNQIKADITGFTVEVPTVRETAVVGSAILAAVGTRAHPDLVAAIRAMTSIERRIEPDPSRREVYDRVYAAYTSLHPALAPVMRTLRDPESEAVR